MAELSTIARPYAEALFASASNDQASSLESWSGLVSELAHVASQDDVREALTDPRLNADHRIELFAGLIKSPLSAPRSEERRVGKACVRLGRTGGSPVTSIQTQRIITRSY